MDDRELALRFLTLFRGYSKCFGQFTAAGQLTSHKVTGSAETIKRPPDVNDVLAHLRGQKRMGMIPLCDDNTVSFCAIDHDAYGENINHDTIAKQVAHLPLILTQSKSGGAHLWMFTKTPLKAAHVIKCLRHWVNELGWSPKTEVFPKQSERANSDDIGNWINLPYFGALSDKPACAAIVAEPDNQSTRTLTLEQFLRVAENSSPVEGYVEEAALKVRSRSPKSADILFSDGPPCIQSILAAAAKEGWSEGSRNNTLWHIAVYLSKQGHDEAKLKAKLDEMNKTVWEYKHPIPGKKDKEFETLQVPPIGLADKEIAAISRSASRKDYGYKCSDEPMKGLCNHSLCKLRQWGVGSGNRPGELEHAITNWVSIQGNPAHWYFSYGDRRIHIKDANALVSARAFKVAIMNATGMSFPNIPDKVFGPMIQDIMENGEFRQATPETTYRYQVAEHLSQFINENPGDSMEDVTQGKAFETDGYYYLQGESFRRYLKRHDSELEKRFNKNEMCDAFEADLGMEYGDDLRPRIKGKQVRLWRVPADAFTTYKKKPAELPGDVM
jgi:hypothetical protein